jgi:DNA-binding MarR family transcriptional regulator
VTEDEQKREQRILEQLRTHRLPAEWAEALGDVDGDAMLVLTWLEVLSRRVRSIHVEEVRRERLTYSEATLLYQLLLAGEPYRQSPTQLNEYLGLTSGGVTKTVDRLEAQELVHRVPDSVDGRSIQVGLTESGLEAARRVARAFASRYEELVKSLAPEEKKQAVMTLRRLLDVFEAPL